MIIDTLSFCPELNPHGRVALSPLGQELLKDDWSSLLNKWHYLGASCKGIVLAWGHSEGCCIYGNPRSRKIELWFPDLKMLELLRMVGIDGHKWSLTSLMAQAHKVLKQRAVDILVTYADPTAGHNGTIYSAGNWVSIGYSSTEAVWTLDGKRISRRWVYDQHGTQSVPVAKQIYGNRLVISPGKPKPRFLLGLTKKGKKAVRSYVNAT